ncbi:MAG: hypothetical protein CO113_14235 [Elusimicrobia bacterium CG_4_9_14_3_um_filter_62_55]|nr:MAG: hypothetical protein CO113_14235 [Elusimicrobia bacterium CG_4_9_14_3_um_filter_62_55]
MGDETLRVLARLIARRLRRELAENAARGHTSGAEPRCVGARWGYEDRRPIASEMERPAQEVRA